MYLQNKYTSWYFSIINNSKNRILNEYTEQHHVIPRSLGGTDSQDNIVSLTAREHFICHLLLPKMVEDCNKFKMLKAALMMAFVQGQGQERYKVNSHFYEILKSNIVVPEATKKKMSIGQKNRFENSPGTFKGRKHSEETKEKIRILRTGKKDSEDAKLIKSIAAKNRPPITDDTRKKLSNASKKRSEEISSYVLAKPKKLCYYCNRELDYMNYAQWHGEKCKQKGK